MRSIEQIRRDAAEATALAGNAFDYRAKELAPALAQDVTDLIAEAEVLRTALRGLADACDNDDADDWGCELCATEGHVEGCPVLDARALLPLSPAAAERARIAAEKGGGHA